MNRYREILTEEVFIIDAIFYAKPATYKTKDQDNGSIKGTFYE